MAFSLEVRVHFDDLVEFVKQVRVQRAQLSFAKKKFIEELFVGKEMKFELRKNDIKADTFRQEKQSEMQRNCFLSWKGQYENKCQTLVAFAERRES